MPDVLKNFPAKMINKSFKGDEDEVRKQLLQYCELDTQAMVEILKKIELVIK